MCQASAVAINHVLVTSTGTVLTPLCHGIICDKIPPVLASGKGQDAAKRRV